MYWKFLVAMCYFLLLTSGTNSCCCTSTGSHTCGPVFFIFLYLSCFPLSLLKATSTPANHPFHYIAFLITVRSSKFIFLESFSPRDFFSIFTYSSVISLQKNELCVCPCVCVWTCVRALRHSLCVIMEITFKLNPSLSSSFLCSLSTFLQLCPSSVITSDFLIVSIFFSVPYSISSMTL